MIALFKTTSTLANSIRYYGPIALLQALQSFLTTLQLVSQEIKLTK